MIELSLGALLIIIILAMLVGMLGLCWLAGYVIGSRSRY